MASDTDRRSVRANVGSVRVNLGRRVLATATVAAGVTCDPTVRECGLDGRFDMAWWVYGTAPDSVARTSA